MVFSKDVTIALLNYRINLLRARGEQMKQNLINALIREKRKLEASN